jgi:tetratricopeptide (TPR) repeat protein
MAAAAYDEMGRRNSNDFPVLTTAGPGFRILAWTFLLALALSVVAGCHPKTAEDDMAAGDQAVKQNKLPEAETDYQSAINAAPGDPAPHIALGKVYLLEQKSDPAELEFMKALDLKPHDASAHAALGDVYAAQTRLELAEAQYRAAAAIAPANTDFRLALGTTLQKENKLPAAEAEFLTAIGLEPKNARAHLALADLLNVEPDRRAEADTEYAEVRALDPSLMPAAQNAGSAAATPTPARAMPAAPAAVASPAMPPLRPVERKFLLTHDSPVYQSASSDSPTVAQVHRRRYVRVTGIQGTWLRIKMRNGTVGFIPISAAE